MKKVLVLVLVASVIQGTMFDGEYNDLYTYFLGGGFDNLDKYHSNDSEIPGKCLDVSRPWNQFLNAFTTNNNSDCWACRDLNAEVLLFQSKFLEEVREKKLVSKEEFCSKYFDDHYNGHYSQISTVFDTEVQRKGLKKESDPKVIVALHRHQNALKKAIEGL